MVVIIYDLFVQGFAQSAVVVILRRCVRLHLVYSVKKKCCRGSHEQNASVVLGSSIFLVSKLHALIN